MTFRHALAGLLLIMALAMISIWVNCHGTIDIVSAVVLFIAALYLVDHETAEADPDADD